MAGRRTFRNAKFLRNNLRRYLCVDMQNDLMTFCCYEEFIIEAWLSTIQVKWNRNTF
jgi:hypothetical protein